MAQGWSWGGAVNNTNGYTSYPNNFVYTDGIGFPTGNQALGGNYPVRIYSVSAAYASGPGAYAHIHAHGVQTGGGYTYGNSGGTMRFMIGHSSGTLHFGRNTNAGNVVRDSADPGSWAGTLCGSMAWATVATRPQGISLSRAGRNITVNIAGSASDGGAGISSYHVQCAIEGQAWGSGGTLDISSGTATFTGLQSARRYAFRTYANNDVGQSLAAETGYLLVPAGGKRRLADGSYVATSIGRRRDATGQWVDLTIAKRRDANGNWIDLS